MGERQLVGALARGEGRPGGARGAVDALDQLGDRGGLEQVADGEFGGERRAGAADEAGGEERVPAEVEEVVVDADGLRGQSEGLGEEVPEGLLARGARGAASSSGAGGVGGGQGADVELAVDGQRQGVHGDERGRDHVVGQGGLEVGAERLRVEASSSGT